MGVRFSLFFSAMDSCIRNLLKRLQRSRTVEKTIVLLIAGLDNAGKSTILNHISGDSDRNVLPTIGFRTISLKHKSYFVKIYDLGGSSQIRGLWPKYYIDIHGLIYVVDACDISRLAENKVVFNELITHEHISTKPILLLANKQDLNGAIDELDIIENLDVERAANAMRCPTRVETCSCIYKKEQSKSSITGIKDGYKWLLDIIEKNYAVLNSRVQQSQIYQHESIRQAQSISSNTPSRMSVGSNPFKPIEDLLAAKDKSLINESFNGTNDRRSIIKVFERRNKTAPLPIEQLTIKCESLSRNSSLNLETVGEKSTQIATTISDLLNVKINHSQNNTDTELIRPYTAPGRSQQLSTNTTIINIPGQVPQ
ncbi:ADP-ribosylation factor-like protein 13B [Monomorium pharaonis]|uniref:ADP-ribosylation factor-like protein 13B n=1 Tax=Monomorium pharaonis TaxID=307658 RepID=UPI00063F637F|nr:ADP-ribosylation factor-like protein 13B [Monomorium pharaonis]XP_028047897.1 ADP-ribosylation factor-like protein 13B [Monomorium pharaonis]